MLYTIYITIFRINKSFYNFSRLLHQIIELNEIFLNPIFSFPEMIKTVILVELTENVEVIETAIVEIKIAAAATKTESEAEMTENHPQTDRIREIAVSLYHTFDK